MSYNPFGPVSDYPKMLGKIAFFNFIASLLIVIFLRWRIPTINTFLSRLPIEIPLKNGLSLPLGTVLPAFVITTLSRIFKLHDKLSDIFLIRQRFDIDRILLPMAQALGFNLSGIQIKKIKEKRKDLMKKVFYKFASSGPGKAEIDSHYITMALDQWSWFWILLEITFLTAVAFLIVLIAGCLITSTILLILLIGMFLLLKKILKECSRYASDQIEQIILSSTRKREIAEVFRAL